MNIRQILVHVLSLLPPSASRYPVVCVCTNRATASSPPFPQDALCILPMGGTQSKEPTVKYVNVKVEVESEASKALRHSLSGDAFEFFKNDEACWGFDEAVRYFQQTEARTLAWDEWTVMRSKLPMRAECPYSWLDKAGVIRLFEQEKVQVHRFYDVALKPMQLADDLRDATLRAEEEARLRAQADQTVRKLTARNDALKDKCAGMTKRLREARLRAHVNSSDISSLSMRSLESESVACSIDERTSEADVSPVQPRLSSGVVPARRGTLPHAPTADEHIASRNM